MRERDLYSDPFAEGWLSYASGAGNPYDVASAEPEEREDAEEWEVGRHSATAFHGCSPFTVAEGGSCTIAGQGPAAEGGSLTIAGQGPAAC